jgi:hypothetical protein
MTAKRAGIERERSYGQLPLASLVLATSIIRFIPARTH